MRDHQHAEAPWSDSDEARLASIVEVRNEWRKYGPLTLRQAYYRLVARGVIENRPGAYDSLVRWVERAILHGHGGRSGDAGHRPNRCPRRIYEDSSWFVDEEEGSFLRGYNRWLNFFQPIDNEVWVLDPTLAHLCQRAADPLDVSVVVTDGSSSVSYLTDLAESVRNLRPMGKDRLRVLLVGDLDPRGWAVLPAMLRTLRDDFGFGDEVQVVRAALTPGQALDLGLPRSPDPLDEDDPRTPLYREWLREQGCDDDLVVELAAVAPGTLVDLVRRSIEERLDMDLLAEERATEADERAGLAQYRRKALAAMEAAFVLDRR